MCRVRGLLPSTSNVAVFVAGQHLSLQLLSTNTSRGRLVLSPCRNQPRMCHPAARARLTDDHTMMRQLFVLCLILMTKSDKRCSRPSWSTSLAKMTWIETISDFFGVVVANESDPGSHRGAGRDHNRLPARRRGSLWAHVARCFVQSAETCKVCRT